MAKSGVTIEGAEELIKSIKKLDKDIVGRGVQQAYRESFRPIYSAIKAAAPKDTGNLKKHIVLRALKRSRVRQGVFVRLGTHDEMGIQPGKVFYPGIHEYGSNEGRQKSNPFVRRSYDHNEESVFSDFKGRLQAIIDRALNK